MSSKNRFLPAETQPCHLCYIAYTEQPAWLGTSSHSVQMITATDTVDQATHAMPAGQSITSLHTVPAYIPACQHAYLAVRLQSFLTSSYY